MSCKGTPVTPEEVKRMIVLYEELGSYKAVGKKMRRSADTVSRHIQRGKTLILSEEHTKMQQNIKSERRRRGIPAVNELSSYRDYEKKLSEKEKDYLDETLPIGALRCEGYDYFKAREYIDKYMKLGTHPDTDIYFNLLDFVVDCECRENLWKYIKN